ncbi:conserved hypothetical protein [Trichinella spiralis]|uniref:hypothetical protein n=1 Tax=Trichinella spiralis TaxID=6334 RepID=UPI0001EFDAD5|nr:conserved hypothetical protein [Trichinella spiralis]
MVHGIIEYDLGSILLVFEPEIMIERNRRGHSYCCVREVRRRSDTALVLTVNYANQRFAEVHLRLGEQLPGKPKCFGSGGSMVAKLKLKGIDGGARPRVEPAA